MTGCEFFSTNLVNNLHKQLKHAFQWMNEIQTKKQLCQKYINIFKI